MTLATKASRWKMTFYTIFSVRFGWMKVLGWTDTAHAYSVLVESAPLYDIGFETVVDPRHELEGKGLCQ